MGACPGILLPRAAGARGCAGGSAAFPRLLRPPGNRRGPRELGPYAPLCGREFLGEITRQSLGVAVAAAEHDADFAVAGGQAVGQDGG